MTAKTGVRVSSSTAGSPSPGFQHLSGGYRWRGDPTRTPDDPRFVRPEARNPGRGRAGESSHERKAARVAAFNKARDAGKTVLEVADATAQAYERERKARLRQESGAETLHGDEEEILSPRQIVERLHEEIAAQSPEHAQLVAGYQRTRAASRVPPDPAARHYPQRARQVRFGAYAALRRAGAGKNAAARGAKVSPTTGRRYEAAMTQGEGTHD